MTGTVKTIREAIETYVEANTAFTKLQNKFDLEKNNFTNEDKRYGVIATDGTQVDDGNSAYQTIDRNFEITLCNKFTSTINRDDKQEIVGDLLEAAMETISNGLQKDRANIKSQVTSMNFAANDPIDFEEIENLAVLKFSMVVQYKKFISC